MQISGIFKFGVKNMKYAIITGKQLTVAVSAVTALFIAAAVSFSMMSASKERKLPIYSVENTNKQIALTFDAAWTDDDTDELISILKKYNVKATFFMVGDWIEKYPESAKKFHKAGHVLANHSDSHLHPNNATKEELQADAEKCNEKIKAITGERPILYRAPYGEYNNNAVNAIEEIGMYFIQWSSDSVDWREEYSVERLVENVMKSIDSGGIILMHNGAKHTPEALPILLEKLISEGYSFVTVDQLILKDNYVIDNTGRQMIKKAE